MVNAETISLVFYADAHPNVVCPFQIRGSVGQSARTFGKDLEAMLGRVVHNGEHFGYEFKRYVGVKEVAHGVHEDGARPFPPAGDIQQIIVELDAEPWTASLRVAVHLVAGVSHCLEALSECEGVAVVASRGGP